MPRLPRFCPPKVPVHVIQRGNNKQACFTSDADFRAYAYWLHEASVKYEVQVHAWVFMTNHVHLLLTPTSDQTISKMMQHVGRLYVRSFNSNYDRTGTLYGGRFRSCLVQNSGYVLNCQRYIELNPMRAGLVEHPRQYPWSSYRAHASGLKVGMHTAHEEYLALASTPEKRKHAYRELLNGKLSPEIIEKIRRCTNTGRSLGNQKFREQIQQMRA